MLRQSLFVFFLLLTHGIFAQTTYFVSLDGSDANDGLSPSSSWRTIRYAASQNSPVTAGDTVYIKAGDYGKDDVYVEKNFSEGDARISFIGYQETPGDILSTNFKYGDTVDPHRMPLINPKDRETEAGIGLYDNYNITIKNIQLANSLTGISIWNTSSQISRHHLENVFIQNIGHEYSTALSIKEADGNIIEHVLIVNATGAGMDIWGNGNLIEDAKVYSNESEKTEDGTYTSMDYYIVLKGDRNVVKNCYIERVGNLEDVGHGMEIKESGEHNLFINCVAKNMVGGGFSVRWSKVRYNEFRNCTATGSLPDVCTFLIRDGASYNVFNNCTSDGCPAGVRFLLSGEDADYCGTKNAFNNCIIKDASVVIDYNPWYYNSAPADSTILANCVLVHSKKLVRSDRPNHGSKMINCIVTQVDSFSTGDQPVLFYFSHCDFYDNGFVSPSGKNMVEGDPLFTDWPAGDYHLTKGSPCIDAGTNLGAFPLDYEGTKRPQGMAFDIGAFEFKQSTATRVSDAARPLFYPNPVSDQLFVLNWRDFLWYEMADLLGHKWKEGAISDGQIHLNSMASGFYTLRLKDRQG